MKPAFHGGRSGAFHFNRNIRRAAAHQHEVNFRTIGGAVVVGLVAVSHRIDDVFDNHPLVAPPRHGVTEQASQGVQTQQGVQQSAVANIGLGAFHEALPDIGKPRRQPAYQSHVAEDIDIPGNRRRCHRKTARQLREIERLPLGMGQHGPKPPNRRCRQARSELRQIAFHIRADQILASPKTLQIIDGGKTIGEAAAHPQLITRRDARCAGFERINRAKINVGNASRQRFRGLLQQQSMR